MEVFGVGYGCTGSQTLQLALQELGFVTFDIANLLLHNPSFNHDDFYREMMLDHAGENSLQLKENRELVEILHSNNYNASIDMSIGLGYERLVNDFPDAKFILTVHDSDEEWFQCWSNIITSVSLLSRYTPWLPKVKLVDRYLRSLLAVTYGNDDEWDVRKIPSSFSISDKDEAIKRYHIHNDGVRHVIPSERRLELYINETHDTWEPLCEFLNLPVPSSEYPTYSYNSDHLLLLARIVAVIANLFLLVILYTMAVLIRDLVNYKSVPIIQPQEKDFSDKTSNADSCTLQKGCDVTESARDDDKGNQEEHESLDWVPKLRIIEDNTASEFCYLLNEDQMQKILIQEVLPVAITLRPWKRLYRLERDGDSFQTFLHSVNGASQTLLVIRTDCGTIFGAYADSPWNVSTIERRRQHHHPVASNGFYGSAQSCLFTFRSFHCKDGEMQKRKEEDQSYPTDKSDEISVYKWTGANRYFQLCDTTNKRIGLGGGENGAFGLVLEDNFSIGSTARCDTYGNEPLCDSTIFNILDVEVWTFLQGHF